MEKNMGQATVNTPKWAKYFDSQKKLWYDPNVSVYIKAIVHIVELHRSDSKGWSLSVRKIASLLGISTNTALKAINTAINAGYLEASKRIPRNRRKLRPSVSLRAPVEFENPSSQRVSQWEEQPVSHIATPSVSPDESVNSKEISKANINESHINKNTEESHKSPPYKENTGFTTLREVMNQRKEGF